MCHTGTTLDHDFYVVVGKQYRTENVYAGQQVNIFINTVNSDFLYIRFI